MDRPFKKLLFVFLLLVPSFAFAHSDQRAWVNARAKDKKQRDQIAAMGVSIETVLSDSIWGVATETEIEKLRSKGLLIETRALDQASSFDFPSEDSKFRNYDELTSEMKAWASANPDFVQLDSIGKSYEGREIWRMRLSTDLKNASSKPGIVFMGGHHAREHISVETPLKMIERLITGYKSGDAEIRRLIETRDIHLIPAVNPDGKEYDISSGRYRMWRKNRAIVNNLPRGVDLNRNYGYGWGGGGSSADPYSEVYRGSAPFSEPETQAIKKFIETQTNLNILLSFHTFSQLILYPWGHTDDPIREQRDFLVHKTMAERMAAWNGYTPEQSSELYIASGDTTDWAYGEHKIISFTFELDPGSMFEGGFYPGADKIDVIAEKNWKPVKYLIDLADNPYRVLEPTHARYGLKTALVQ